MRSLKFPGFAAWFFRSRGLASFGEANTSVLICCAGSFHRFVSPADFVIDDFLTLLN